MLFQNSGHEESQSRQQTSQNHSMERVDQNVEPEDKNNYNLQ